VANSLIVFTPRSGSTIAAELLAYKNKAINLDEFMAGNIRKPLFKRLPNDVASAITNDKVLNDHCVEMQTQMSEGEKLLLNFHLYEKRFEAVKRLHEERPIVIKYWPAIGLPGVKFIEWTIENGYDVYFTKRRCIEDQLYSYLLADVKETFYRSAVRAGKLNIEMGAGFINTKSTPNVVFPPVALRDDTIISRVTDVLSLNLLFTSYYNKFKDHAKLIVYEDSIVKNNFMQFGISDNLASSYFKQQHSLRPTTKYVVGDQIKNWDRVIEILGHFNTLSNE